MVAFLVKYLVPLWYTVWCRIYNFFENEYCGMIVVPLWDRKGRPQDAWLRFASDIKYKKDGVTMLWDVCSIPPAVMLRKHGDCDDFARLAREFLGAGFDYDGKTYLFLGLYSLIYSRKPHHVVAVYRERGGKQCITVGQSFTGHTDFEGLLRHYDRRAESPYEKDRLIEYCVVYGVSGWKLWHEKFIDCREIAR